MGTDDNEETMNHLALGVFAEKIAADFLRERGYTILEQNYRKPWGEIDIVTRKKDTLVFVEVKANRNYQAGFEPELRANRDKQQKLIRTARTYLAQHRLEARPWQIDIISVTLDTVSQKASIKHFKNIDTT